jgi:hypothetical protein
MGFRKAVERQPAWPSFEPTIVDPTGLVGPGIPNDHPGMT